MQQIGYAASKEGRRRSIERARLSFNAALPRQGRVQRAARRCLIAKNGVASMRDLRDWAYPGQPRLRWHRWSIVRALAKLGCKRIGWGIYAI